MNIERRARLGIALDRLDEVNQELQSIRDEEQDYLDAIPENLLGSDAAGKAEEFIEAIDYIINEITCAPGALEEF